MSANVSPVAEFISTNEKVFCFGGFEIPYLFVRGSHYQNELCVIFSAFNEENAPNQLTYNYVRTLIPFEGNKLFILDNFGTRGGYYMGTAPDFNFGTAIQALIEMVRNDLGVTRENVICIGGSKGGTASLYHSILGDYGVAIAGAPQIRIASYLEKCAMETHDLMFGIGGGQDGQGDEVLLNMCKRDFSTRIIIITSPNDWQYEEHVIPFIQELHRQDKRCKILIDVKGRAHNDIANYFLKNLCRLIVETILEKSKNSWHMDLEDFLRGYVPQDQSNYDKFHRRLKVIPERITYIHTFDGNFNSPGSEELSRKMSRVPPGFKEAIVTVDQHFSEEADFAVFLIQFTNDAEVQVNRSSKTLRAKKGDVRFEMPVTIVKDPIGFKVALRYKSERQVEVDVKRLSIDFIN